MAESKNTGAARSTHPRIQSAVNVKVESPGGSGAYNNYYKADKDAAANPSAYNRAKGAVSSAISKLGLSGDWLKPTLELVARESSFNHLASNAESSAKGLFQFLDQTRKDYGKNVKDWNDPYQQALAGLEYIQKRYGSPDKALAFWDDNKWY